MLSLSASADSFFKVSQDGLAHVEGCSSQGLGCIGDSKVIRISEHKAMSLSISGIMQNGAVIVGNRLVSSTDIAHTQNNACIQLKQETVCVGDKIALPGEQKLRQVAGLFDNGDLAVYDSTIFSANVRIDYFRIIQAENLR